MGPEEDYIDMAHPLEVEDTLDGYEDIMDIRNIEEHIDERLIQAEQDANIEDKISQLDNTSKLLRNTGRR